MENYLPVYEKVFCEKTEKSISTEVTLPEYLPGAARVVKVSVIPTVSETEVFDDSVSCSGRAVFALVYMSDFNDKLKCAVFPVEFSHVFPARGIKSELGDDGFIDCYALALEEKAALASSRKFNLFCKLNLFCDGTSVKRNSIFDPGQDNNLKKLTNPAKVLKIAEMPLYEIRIDENITLDGEMPQAQEIIFADCNLSVEDTRISDGICTCSGCAAFNCMYLSEDTAGSAEYVSLVKNIPFSAQISTNGIPEEAYVLCKTSLSSISADALSDSYGDKKIISVTAVGNINSKAYFNEEASVCEDVFCTLYPCECEVKELSYDSFIAGFTEKMRLDESVRANLGNITDIISQSASASVISTDSSDSKIVVNAKITVRLTGTGELGNIECTSFSFGTKLALSGELCGKYEKCKFDTSIDVLDCRCRIVNGEIKCELEVCCKAAALAKNHARAVTAVQIDEGAQLVRDASEYVIYYPDKDDTLWLTAKKYKVSPEELMAINGMEKAEEIAEKKTLVIPR